tara:strand:- start:366 stop:683 length:318 start_codon:yes stop_codon:yes gene_type:complete
MSTYASNKNAYGICDVTGFRYKLKDMKRTWNGLIVGPDQFDPKHPQLDPRIPPVDGEAIKDARPDTSDDNNFFTVYTNVGLGKLGKQLTTYEIACEVGSVNITTT